MKEDCQMKSPLRRMLLPVALWAFSAQADLTVHDPQGILPASDAFLGTSSFDAVFHCGDTTTLELNSCGKGSQTRFRDSVVADCSADRVVLRNFGVDPSADPKDTPITRADFQAVKGNFLRYLIAQFSHSSGGGRDFIDLERTALIDYATTGGTTHGMKIYLTYSMCNAQGRDCQPLPLSIVLGRDVPGVAQFMELFLMPGDCPKPIQRVMSFHR